MKTSIKVLLLPLFTIFLSSCGGDDNDQLDSGRFLGRWYGSHFYYNSVGGYKYQHLTVDFYENQTGRLEYEQEDIGSYAIAEFKWSSSGDFIFINGIYVSANGGGIYVDDEFSLAMRITNDDLLDIVCLLYTSPSPRD